MPRPGCVWTHTIVIPALAMAQIPSLDALQRLFKRPTKQATMGHYAKPIPLEHALRAIPTEPLQQDSRQKIESLLSLHYGNVARAVLIAARNSKEFEDVIFAVWSQKWPNLRMGFTFCTGSLSTRNFGKRPFDVQCVPMSMTREVLLEITGAGIAEPVILNSGPMNAPSWAALAADDASRYENAEARDFLWKVSDANSGRAEFALFMAVFETLRHSPPLSTLIALVVKLFPNPSAGQHLKSLLFSSQPNQSLLHPQEEQVTFPRFRGHPVKPPPSSPRTRPGNRSRG